MPISPPCMSQLELGAPPPPAGAVPVQPLTGTNPTPPAPGPAPAGAGPPAPPGGGGACPAFAGDDPAPRLDEPACQEQVLSQRMHAVAVADRPWLALQIERLASRRESGSSPSMAGQA